MSERNVGQKQIMGTKICFRNATTLRMILSGGVFAWQILGSPHWPVGRDGLTGQDAFAYAGTINDE